MGLYLMGLYLMGLYLMGLYLMNLSSGLTHVSRSEALSTPALYFRQVQDQSAHS